MSTYLTRAENTSQQKQSMSRYKELDGLRGIAALTVFASHFTISFTHEQPWFSFAWSSPLHALWDGGAAVILFFTLSGFVLSLPFINRDVKIELIPFYLRRICRIYPALLFAIAAALCLKVYVYDPEQIKGYSGWIQGLWSWKVSSLNFKEVIQTMSLLWTPDKPNKIIPVLWSLVVEMKMSLIIPFLIFIVSRTNLLFNIILLGVCYYITKSIFLPVFYSGVLLAKYQTVLVNRFRLLNKAAAVLILFIAILLYSARFSFNIDPWITKDTYYKTTALYLIIAAGSGLFILLSLSRNRIQHFLTCKPVNFLGNISYSFYLIHLPVYITVCSLIPNNYMLTPLLVLITALAFSLLVSWLMYRYIEIPFRAWIKRFLKNRKYLSVARL